MRSADSTQPTIWLRATSYVGRLLLLASTVLLVFIVICYAARFDRCAFVTVFPPWVWLIPGLSSAFLAYCGGHRRTSGACALLWIGVVIYFTDTPLSLVRAVAGDAAALVATTDESNRQVLRVVTLNCHGSPEAAREIVDLKPDIVLLQESPSRESVEALANELFGEQGGAVWGPDASIVARGIVEPIDIPWSLRRYSAFARLELPSGDELTVVSVHVWSPHFRLDFWSADCWQSYADNRRQQRKQLQAVVERLPLTVDEVPLIVGGDFNAPPDDAIFRLLQPQLRDVFRQAGVGWGNTIDNELPLIRIDQIWASEHFAPKIAYAQATKHTDHRLVYGELLLAE